MTEERVSKINQLNELELLMNVNGVNISIEWFRAMYVSRVPNRTWHYHRGTEIHYMMEGAIEITFDDAAITLKKGEAIIIPSGMRHRLSETASQQPFYKVVLNYLVNDTTQDLGAIQMKEMLQMQNRSCVIITPAIQELLEFTIEESVNKQYGFLTVIEGSLLSILMLTSRLVLGKRKIEYIIPRKKNVYIERMESIERFAKDNIGRKITADDIAHHINLSSKQVNRVILYCRGKSTQEYITEIKIEKAKEMLKNPENSMAYIAEVLGFCNEYYFNRFFKRVEGMPPGKYKKSTIS